MGQYTKEEIQAFTDKDLRITKLAILKSLIEKFCEEDVYEVEKITELTEKYVDYVYEERKQDIKGGTVGSVTNDVEPKHQVNWEQAAIGLNFAIPNSQNIKILNQIADEYKKAYKANANPKDILVHIISVFGRYPTKTESVKKIIDSLFEMKG